MSIGILTLIFQIPGCASLKEKRSRIKPLIARLHREFNISVAEVDRQDAWQEAVITCVIVSNEAGYNHRALSQVIGYVEKHWPDLTLVDQRIENF